MKNALVLSGGGFKGAIQYGAIQELTTDIVSSEGIVLRKGIKFDYCSGISVGALNAAFVSADEISQLGNMWKSVKDTQGGLITNPLLAEIKNGKLELNFEKLLNTAGKGVNFWDITKGIFGKKGKNDIAKEVMDNINMMESILDNTPLYQLLLKHIDLKKIKIPYGCGLTSLETGLPHKLTNKDFNVNAEFAKAILASATMPGIWKSVSTIKTRRGVINFAVDGGIRTVSPIGQVFDYMKEGEDWTIWIINCNSRKLPFISRDMWNITNTGGRSLEILLNQVFDNDMGTTLFINENAEYLNMNPNNLKKRKKAILNIIEPQAGDSGGTLDATPDMIDYRIELGRALAQNFLL